MSDVDRSAVYAAELAAFDGTDLESPVAFDVLAAVVEAVVTGEWWPGPAVSVRAARRDAGSSSTRCFGEDRSARRSEIRLASGQLTIATGAHELAHALAGSEAGHGPIFRIAYLDVVAVITNLDSRDRRHDLHSRQLSTAFTAARLVLGSRQWPPPPVAASGPIAL